MDAEPFERIESRRELPLAEFNRTYAAPARAVHLAGLAAGWPATRMWSLTHLARSFGDLVLRVEERPERRPDRLSPAPLFRVRLDEYVELLRDTSFEGSGVRYYATETPIPPEHPIRADFAVPEPCRGRLRFDEPLLFFGPGGTRSGLHFDIAHNLFVQVKGRKRVLLLDPLQSKHVHAGRWYTARGHHSDVDVLRPDPARFPRFRAARVREVVLDAGDALFIPGFWWHEVISLEESISLSFFWSNLPARPGASRGAELLRSIVRDGVPWPRSPFHLRYVAGYVWNRGRQSFRPLQRVPELGRAPRAAGPQLPTSPAPNERSHADSNPSRRSLPATSLTLPE